MRYAKSGPRIIRNVGIVVGLKPDLETETQVQIILDNENPGGRVFRLGVECLYTLCWASGAKE